MKEQLKRLDRAIEAANQKLEELCVPAEFGICIGLLSKWLVFGKRKTGDKRQLLFVTNWKNFHENLPPEKRLAMSECKIETRLLCLENFQKLYDEGLNIIQYEIERFESVLDKFENIVAHLNTPAEPSSKPESQPHSMSPTVDSNDSAQNEPPIGQND